MGDNSHINYLAIGNARNGNKNVVSADSKMCNTAGKEVINKNLDEVVAESPRLRLKDYLRLQTITKRSNSAASSKKKDSPYSSPDKA